MNSEMRQEKINNTFEGARAYVVANKIELRAKYGNDYNG